jgi:hypothetical protein
VIISGTNETYHNQFPIIPLEQAEDPPIRYRPASFEILEVSQQLHQIPAILSLMELIAFVNSCGFRPDIMWNTGYFDNSIGQGGIKLLGCHKPIFDGLNSPNSSKRIGTDISPFIK